MKPHVEDLLEGSGSQVALYPQIGNLQSRTATAVFKSTMKLLSGDTVRSLVLADILNIYSLTRL